MEVLIVSCTANSNLEYKTPKRCVSPLRQRLAVVKWYRIDADWYKPDPTRLADRRTKPNLKRSKRGRASGIWPRVTHVVHGC